MRVVLVTNGLLYGGAERIVEALAFGLVEAGDDVHVVATTRGGPIGESLRARGIGVSVLEIQNALDARVAWKLGSILRRFRAEIVHSHLAVSDLATAAARAFAPRAKIVSTVHSAYLDLAPLPKQIWKRVLRTFHRVLAVSDHVRGLLPPDLPVEVVRPSLIDTGAADHLDRAAARARLGIDADKRLVMSVGRLVSVKGYDVLAAALREMRATNVRAVIIGEGPERENLARERLLELAGARDDAGELVAAADVLASPSRSEGFPQAPLHAMAASVPVVATAVGGTPEIVEQGRTGILVPPDDPVALARALDDLLGDPARAKALGEAGRRRLLERGLTKRAMIERTREIYCTLIR